MQHVETYRFDSSAARRLLGTRTGLDWTGLGLLVWLVVRLALRYCRSKQAASRKRAASRFQVVYGGSTYGAIVQTAQRQPRCAVRGKRWQKSCRRHLHHTNTRPRAPRRLHRVHCRRSKTRVKPHLRGLCRRGLRNDRLDRSELETVDAHPKHPSHRTRGCRSHTRSSRRTLQQQP